MKTEDEDPQRAGGSSSSPEALQPRDLQRAPAPADQERPGGGVEVLGDQSFPVVAIGASAGGLEAFTSLLRALPTDTGMAFVLVPHLSPKHTSALAEILSRATSMPVTEVTDEPEIRPNHVYVIPPGRDMFVRDGHLALLERDKPGVQHPVDLFFRSLAETRREQSIGVVLSGTANDGTLGLEQIKAAGGITFAQDDTAQQVSMPRSAIASGCVDYVLPPAEIARELARIAKHPYLRLLTAETEKEVDQEPGREGDRATALTRIFQLLERASGVDFSSYKSSTLNRRIDRRMLLHKLSGRGEYADYLERTPAEIELLCRDILISVTSFFRDPETFEQLREVVFPKLIQE